MSATTLLGRKKVDELGFISGNADFETFQSVVRRFFEQFGALASFGDTNTKNRLIGFYFPFLLRAFRYSNDSIFDLLTLYISTKYPLSKFDLLAHEHLHMNFDCSFHQSKHCSVDSNKKLVEMSQPECAMVRQFPYHFYDNLNLTDYEAGVY